MTGFHLIALVLSFAVAVTVTPFILWLAKRWKIVDDPQAAPDRKRHSMPVPLLGGWAILLGTWVAWLVLWRFGQLPAADVSGTSLIGLVLSGVILGVGGWVDDRRHLSARQQIWWVAGAAVVIIGAGVGISFITNPFGGIWYLNGLHWTLFQIGAHRLELFVWSDIFALFWLLGATYTTKILDGLDGLVSGLGVLGGLIVFLLTLRPEVSQPGIGALALSLAGASAGFLVWNWHPAKIFLGEAGSLYIGFMLGVLAIISGGKIATALLILGLPIFDLMWVMFQRLRAHRSPFTTSDRLHLHFRLLDAGLSPRQSVSIIYLIIAVFGLSTLYVPGVYKVAILFALLLVTALLVWWVMHRSSRTTA